MIRQGRTFLIVIVLLSVVLGMVGWQYSKVRQLEEELASLKDQYNLLLTNYGELESSYGKVWTEEPATLAEVEQSLTAPYTSISDGKVAWLWKDREGNGHKWVLPLDSYRSWSNTPKPYKTISIRSNDSIYTVVDYRPYVHPDEFTEVIPSLYQQFSSEREFVQEAFNLVSQLTVYTEDIGEVPQWPIETLTEGRGDCEDLTILLASLLKAAPYPYKLSLVYTDTDNPTAPQYPNHVILAIEDDEWRIFIESTKDDGWKYYKEVSGWFFEF